MLIACFVPPPKDTKETSAVPMDGSIFICGRSYAKKAIKESLFTKKTFGKKVKLSKSYPSPPYFECIIEEHLPFEYKVESFKY